VCAGVIFTHTLGSNNRAGQEDLNRAPDRKRERERQSNLEKSPQLGYISFIDLAHIGLSLVLNSELHSNLEEKEFVRSSGVSVMNISIV